MFQEWGINVNKNLQHSIDIKPIEIDISQEMYRFYCIWNDIEVVSRVMRKIDYGSGRNLLQWAA